MKSERTEIVLYQSQYTYIKDLTEKQKAEILDAIYKYNLGEDFVFEEESTNVIFCIIQEGMDIAAEKWHERHNACAINGSLGGKAKSNRQKTKKSSQGSEQNKNEHPLKDEKITKEYFREFRAWMWENCPSIMAKKPFFKSYITEKEYEKLIKRIDPLLTPDGCVRAEAIIKDLLLQIENRNDYIKRYQNLYITINTWLNRDQNRSLTTH